MASKAASKAAERFLPWLPLRLAQMPEVGSRTLVFRSEQSVGKIEVKRYLAAMYGLDVSRVDSANHEGEAAERPAVTYSCASSLGPVARACALKMSSHSLSSKLSGGRAW